MDEWRKSTSRAPLTHGFMAVENGDGSLSWTGAIGEATPEGHPMRADTPFFIASIPRHSHGVCTDVAASIRPTR